MIRKTDPDGIPRGNHEDFDSPPCTLDECGPPLPEDPLYDERHGLHGTPEDAMHEREKEEK